MTRAATLPLGEVVTLDDNAPVIMLHEAPATGRYGLAPWQHQGRTYLLTPRTDAVENGSMLPSARVSGELADEVGALVRAQMQRSLPKVGGVWRVRNGGNGGNGSVVATVVAASSVAARSHVLAWLDASQAPLWSMRSDGGHDSCGAGWYPCVIEASATLDTDSHNTRSLKLVHGRGPRSDSGWREPGVWCSSVPYKGRLVDTLAPPIDPLYQWTPDDTDPGTLILWPDGHVPYA